MTELEGCAKSAGVQVIAIEGVGWVKFVVFQGDEQVNSAVHLLSIFVEPTVRRNGYAGQLLKKLTKYAQDEGVNYIYVHVSQRNTVLQCLLAKYGFEPRQDKLLFTKSTRSVKDKLGVAVSRIAEKVSS